MDPRWVYDGAMSWRSCRASGVALAVLTLARPCRADEPPRSVEEIASEEAVEGLREVEEGDTVFASPGLLVFGISVTAGGLACWVLALRASLEPKAPGDDDTTETALAVAGVMAVGAGTPAIVFGARRVPTHGGVRPTVAVGPGTVSARWEF
jgi:hypothetical protein